MAKKLAAPGSAREKLKLNDRTILGLAMRTFNLWRNNATNVRRIDPRLDDAYPRIEAPDEMPASSRLRTKRTGAGGNSRLFLLFLLPLDCPHDDPS